MVYPAGGAPQEGEGQPQQHGVWLESQGLLGRRGQAIPSQRGASPDLMGLSMAGGGALLGLRSPVVPSWCWESFGTWMSATGPFIPSWAMWAPLQEEGGRGQQGAGRSWWGSSWGNPQSHPGGGSRTCSVVVLAPQPTQIQGDNDRYFTLTSGSLFWALALDLDIRGGGGVLRALPSWPNRVSLTGVLQGSCPQSFVGPRAPASCRTRVRVQNPQAMTRRRGAGSGLACAQPHWGTAGCQEPGTPASSGW